MTYKFTYKYTSYIINIQIYEYARIVNKLYVYKLDIYRTIEASNFVQGIKKNIDLFISIILFTASYNEIKKIILTSVSHHRTRVFTSNNSKCHQFRVNRSREKILSRENSVENGTPVPSNIHKSVIATTGRKVSENSIILRNPFEKPRHLEFPWTNFVDAANLAPSFLFI